MVIYSSLGSLVYTPFRRLKADFQSSHEAPRSEFMYLIKINGLAL
jgi:hypothetical protein